ncbi:MAG TPA: hypothetical protein VFK04_10760 [Gemmatimonadaceae bacterium]|nr:hypothetical protein [Gemmatimonadaceae bacterium]
MAAASLSAVRLTASHLSHGTGMRHPYLASLLAAASVAALAACGETPTSTRNAQVARATTAPLALSCDINALRTNARDFAASRQDPLFTVIGDLQQLVKNGPSAAGTDKAFDGLARLAAIRGTSAQGSSATGSVFNALTLGFLGCMESYISANVPGDFSVAGALSPGWMYEVRGKASDAAAGVYERGESPYWAAEAPQGWAVASTSVAKRFLVYGYRLTDFLTSDPTVGSAFEVSTIPTIASGKLTLGSQLTIGECEVEVTNTLRVQHQQTILKEKELSCDAPPAFASLSPAPGSSGFSPLRLARHALDLFTPRTLEATMIIGSVGGGRSVLSPFAVIDMQSVQLAFVDSIVDGRISRPLAYSNGNPVQVQVSTLNGSPLSGATVTLSIAGNSSSIAFFQDGSAAASVTVARTTDANGLATFDNVKLTKAGGYTILASGSFDGVPGTSTLSNPFNIQNK